MSMVAGKWVRRNIKHNVALGYLLGIGMGVVRYRYRLTAN